VAVPRTRSRRLDLQPHVDLAMSAATLDPRQRRWRTRRGYLFNHQALAKVLRGKRVSGGRTSVVVQAPKHSSQQKCCQQDPFLLFRFRDAEHNDA